MLKIAKKGKSNVKFVNKDLEKIKFKKSDLITSLYTIQFLQPKYLSLIHISEPTRRRGISYAVFCLKKKT